MKNDYLPRAGPFWKLRTLLHIGGFARVFLRLFWDARVPIYAKLVPVIAFVYLISPIDLDFIPIIGQVDDLVILFIMLRLYVRLCPANVVDEQVAFVEGCPFVHPVSQPPR